MALPILTLAAGIELLTVVGRIWFGPMKDRYPKRLLRVRVHHGYIGLLLVLIWVFWPEPLLISIGMAFFLSDFVHHFVVLPLWVNRTEFP